ncbi:MAG TPA: phosphatase PAP2 family protein [Polyangiaceae bacterium]
MNSRPAAGWLAAITVLCCAGDAVADGPAPPDGAHLVAPPPLVWDPGWKAFGTGDYTLTGLSAGVAIAGAIVTPLPHHLYGGVAFDDAVRNALEIRPSNIGARYVARDTSDVLLSLAVTSPFFFDAMLTAWYQRRSPEIAEQMALVDAEAFAIAGAAQEVTTALVSRERPYGVDCGGALPSTTLDCTNPGRYRSFFSGHATLSFTAAGLTCEHHLTLGLLGGVEDALVCAGAFVLAATTATLRVASDQHYATDVLAGALVGTAIGLGVPALHYSGSRWSEPLATGSLELRVVPTGFGASVLGVFR